MRRALLAAFALVVGGPGGGCSSVPPEPPACITGHSPGSVGAHPSSDGSPGTMNGDASMAMSNVPAGSGSDLQCPPVSTHLVLDPIFPTASVAAPSFTGCPLASPLAVTSQGDPFIAVAASDGVIH